MRKQYYFRESERGMLAWDVDRLIQLSAAFKQKTVDPNEIQELDEPWSGDDENQTWRAMLVHVQLMEEADLKYPIVLASDGRVMDGMHRIAKAVRLGLSEVKAVQFVDDPEPDFVGLGPNELSY